MDRRGPREDRLDRVPARPHPMFVIIPALVMIVVLGLIYRYAGTRWPGNASGNGAVDISETDAGHRLHSATGAVPSKGSGATPAGGFHKAAPAQ